MNFNVHRRNRSLVGQQSQRERREGKSNKKVAPSLIAENLLSEAKDIYHSQGDLQQAVRLFSQYIAMNPKHWEAIYLCSVCQLKIGEYQCALGHLSLLPEDYVQSANALLLSAMALNKLGRTTQSLETVNRCINRFNDFEQAVCFRGKLYMTLNYYHRAEQDFNSLASKPNSTFLPHNSLGDCFRAQNKPQKAIGPYLQAIQMLECLTEINQSSGLLLQLYLKVGICLYQLQRWRQAVQYIEMSGRSENGKGCEYYYYLGGCYVKLNQREKGLLNLQYCLRTQGSQRLMKRAFKKLIQLYLQNYQFYEALNVVKLGEINGLKMEGWGGAVQAFMLIIKGSFEAGLKTLNQIYNKVKTAQQNRRTLKIKRDSSQSKAPKQTRYTQVTSFSKKLFGSSPSKFNSKQAMPKNKGGKLGYFSTKSVLRAVPKIQSLRLNDRNGLSVRKRQQTRLKTDITEKQKDQEFYKARQKEFMIPLILQFKAYAQFFLGNYLQCLDSYEQYQTYIKDNFGRDSDVLYNKSLCQGLLMAESQMSQEALTKYGTCLDLYYQKNGTIPVQPLLYKIVLLVRLGVDRSEVEIRERLSSTIEEDTRERLKLEDQASSIQILQSTLEMMENYQAVLGNHSISLYFRALVCFLLKRVDECRDWLQKALKVAQDCSWKCLWVKGVVEMRLHNYYQAVKQFSAGLILQNRPELYLGRSISYLRLSEQAEKGDKNDVRSIMRSVHLGETCQAKQNIESSKEAKSRSDSLIENCFEDLQKYIELETIQQDISVWVSKILFRNRAYDEAIRSLIKINNKTDEVNAMIQAVSIYEGEFEEGGPVGVIVKSAFQGNFLTPLEEEKLLHGKSTHIIEGQWFSSDYQRWLIALHLYVKENYSLLLKYLQKELFGCQEGNTHALLRYNIAIAYLLLGEQRKAMNAMQAITTPSLQSKMQQQVSRLEKAAFDQDECLEDIRDEIGICCSKLLSNYLPFRPVMLSVPQQAEGPTKSVRIYVRPNIPFPEFASPCLELEVGLKWIKEQVSVTAVEKRLQAPWIHKTQQKTVQFTEKLQESGVYLTGDTTSLKVDISGTQSYFE